MRISVFTILLSASLLFASCKDSKTSGTLINIKNTKLIEINKLLTDAQVDRHFTPPVAARNYAYPNVAVYIALQPFFSNKYKPLAGIVKHCQISPSIDSNLTYDLELIALKTFLDVTYAFIYQDSMIGQFRSNSLADYKKSLNPDVYTNSINYADKVVKEVLDWADHDMYRETRNMSEFSAGAKTEEWKPTSPDYMAAIEPNWNKIKSFFLDSASQFKPIRPTEVSLTKGSPFMKETLEVINAVNDSTPERIEIAQFWDCNPNISHTNGHLMYFFQKISPGGHWIHIALQAIEQKDLDLMESAEKMAITSMAIHDAFIACWDEKYRSNYVRPISIIKTNIDKNWEPILQTPAFPEYPSGHSVASAAAATVLTHLLGSPFQFIDSTELEFGLPNREFSSFREAADEAAISRMYGGIHFMPAIEEGVGMGNKVGELIIQKANLKNNN